ncbi:MAG: exodeoxyribonuclease VII large subunit [Bacteroidaceae bacterium]|nr:exodeoxyribonuclease VII large subunit [Bacteroidaceae bacterium]
MHDTPSLTLFELNSLVKCAVNTIMIDGYWVTAEISDFSVRRHCYLEFVQKDIQGNGLVAKARGTIWSSDYEKISRKFVKATGCELRSGIKVMVYAHVTFHELYGFSLNITDIDPAYTLGDLAKHRQEILDNLKEQGVLDLQKELEIPVLCQRIAVISSEKAAGYGDFCNQLLNNDSGLKFYPKLFPAIMQGDKVEQTVINALDAIAADIDNWDVVVIIRGGGATADMSGFDTLALAENVANFPLPIITGIGHERDDTVLDLISNTRVKTPTAAAEFLIHHLEDTAYDLQDYGQRITTEVKRILQNEHSRIDSLTAKVPMLFEVLKTNELNRMDAMQKRIESAWQMWHNSELQRLDSLVPQLRMYADAFLQSQKYSLALMEEKQKNADPEILLSRGYCMTMLGDKIITNASQLAKGDKITVRFKDGNASATVDETDVRGKY